MMKLSMDSFTLSRRYGDVKMIELLAEAGFDAVDLSIYRLEHAKDTFYSENYIPYLNTLKRAMEVNHMECNQAHAEFSFQKSDTMELANPHFFQIVRGMECAAYLGAKQIVVHGIGSEADPDFLEYNHAFYKSLEPYCKRYNIRAAVENLFEYDGKRKCYCNKLSSPALLNRLLDRLGSQWFTVCADLGHAYVTGTAPEDFIRCFHSDRLCALHVQDTDDSGDCHTLPYLRSLNWDNITQALADIGYQGDFSMEILYYAESFCDELIPDALKFAAQVGRHLISRIERS